MAIPGPSRPEDALVITRGVFGALGGEPQLAGAATSLWLQNAGFVFVPFIVVSALSTWFGIDDIATIKSSFADQSVIFRRSHNWIMCWLYTGTFGSLIGLSTAFPLLTKALFPEVNAVSYAFSAHWSAHWSARSRGRRRGRPATASAAGASPCSPSWR